MVPKLTNNGTNLLVRAIAGEPIVFTKISVGAGDAPADYKVLNNLQHGIVDMEIDELVAEEDYAVIKASMNNADFSSGFYWTELGVYAQDPDGGDDVLYAYAHYKLTGDDAATYIPAFTSSLVEITHIVHVFVGDLENVTAVLTKHSEFASAEDFKKHLEAANPHKVDKKTVGLELIVNAKPEDQKPEFSTLSSAYSVGENGKLSFANIFSGEKVGNILQKIRTFIEIGVAHINAKNPHNVKLSDMEDILPVESGGTGANKGSEGLKNLLAAGPMILSANQLVDELPAAGVKDRILFKRVIPNGDTN